VVVANKCDAASDEEIEMFVEGVKERGYEDIFVISAAVRIGIKELTDKVTELVSKLPQTVLHDELTDDHKIYKFEKEDQFNIVRSDDGAFEITGTWALVTMESTNFDDTDSLAYFQRSMINSGVIDALKAAGIKEGDTVRIGDLEFDYFE
jgi:GTP-binding protein